MFEYDFRIEYRPGKANVVADALSHRDDDTPLLAGLCDTDAASLAVLSAPTFRLFDDLRQELDTDATLRARCDAVAAGAHGASWTVQEGLIFHDGRVFLPATSPLLDDVLQIAHTGAHEGVQKTLRRLRTQFYVEHDWRVVGDFVRSCSTCQRNKTETLHPAGLLQPLPVPLRV